MMGGVATVFTTALCDHGRVQWLEEHLARLAEHACALSIPYPGDETLRERLVNHLDPHNLQLVKISIGRASLDITTRPLHPPSEAQYAGVPIVVTDVIIDSTLASFKTEHREPYNAARQIADTKGAFEGLLVDDDGYVVDGSRSSPLLFTGDTLVSLEGGIKGITRENVLKSARKLGLRIERQKLRQHELSGLVLVAGSGIGLVPSARPANELLKTLILEHQIRALPPTRRKP